MPRYPGGDYYLPPGTTAAPDTTIQSTPYNTFTADVETELNRQIHKDADQDAALAAIGSSTVAFTPTGDIVATNVQDAIVEVDTEMHAADATLTTAVGTAQTTADNAATAAASADANANNRVLKAGDTMTGNLTVPITFTHLQAPSGIGGDFNTSFTNTKFNTFVYAGESSPGANAPTGSGWYMSMTMKHSNAASPWGVQAAWGWGGNDNELYTRTVSNNSFSGWVRYLNANNYSSYALPIAGGTITGNLTVNATITANFGSFTTGWDATCVNATLNYGGNSGVRIMGSQDAFMSFHRLSGFAANFGLGNDNTLRWGGWSHGGNYWRLWSERDGGWPLSNGRLPYAGDQALGWPSSPYTESVANALLSGGTANNIGYGNNVTGFRYRLVQGFTSAWFTFAYA